MRIVQIYFKNCVKKMFFKKNKAATGTMWFILPVWPFFEQNYRVSI